MAATRSTIQMHSDCLVAVLLDGDDSDYSEHGDKGMCRNCRRRYDTARRKAVRIVAAAESGWRPTV